MPRMLKVNLTPFFRRVGNFLQQLAKSSIDTRTYRCQSLNGSSGKTSSVLDGAACPANAENRDQRRGDIRPSLLLIFNQQE